MSRDHGSLATLAAVGVVWLGCCLVAGCATTDCTETATCPDPFDAADETAQYRGPDGGEADNPSGEAGELPEAMGTAGGGSDGEAAGEDAGSPPVIPSDAGPDGAGAPDAKDAAPVSTIDAAADAWRACIPSGPEICNNGVDDDCNGFIDCADHVPCGGSVCADPVAAGWVGPALLWTGPYPAAQIPACPAGFQAIDAFQGLTFPNDLCSCSCTPTGQQCSPSVTAYADQACMNRCLSVTLSGGGCTTLPTNTCQQNGTFQVNGAPSPGGTCAAAVTTVDGGAPSWTDTVRLCTSLAAADAPGGCTAPGAQCLADPAPFGSVCVSHAGAVSSCPPGYNAIAPMVVYSGATDHRGCSDCTCGAPTGAKCSGSVSFYAGTICTGTVAANGPTCSAYTLNPKPGSARATYTLTAGNCSVISPTSPTGAVSPTGATTVCCR